jgi:hypothetical protein
MKRRDRTGNGKLAWVKLAALALVVGAVGCATGTGDDTGESSGVTGDSAVPTASASPSGSGTNGYGYQGDASSPPSKTAQDSGAGAMGEIDAGSSSPPVSFDASAPPATMPGTCDPNNPKYLLELFTTADAGACPCAASECCFSGLVCLPE